MLPALLLVALVDAAENSVLPDNLPPYRPDFTGSWEKDFQRSDRWDEELTRQIEQILQAQQSQSGNPQGNLLRPTLQLGNVPRGRPAELVDLARLAELISRQNVIDIIQTKEEVVVRRQGDAALICGTRQDVMQSFTSPYGNEVCGWEREQLVFRISLPEGVDILHRFSVSPDAQWMNLLTSISRRGSTPFNLIQVYRRFELPPDAYNCVQTLSRGRVCSATGATGEQ